MTTEEMVERMKLAHQKMQFEKLTSEPTVDSISFVTMQKAASADRCLLEVAAFIDDGVDILNTYEELGGTFDLKVRK